MSTDLVLRRRAASAPLTAKSVEATLAKISRESEIAVQLDDARRAIRFRIRLSARDPDAASVGIAFSTTGAHATGTMRGRAGPLLYWCFHRLAEHLASDLEHPQADPEEPSDGAEDLEGARDVVVEHEESVLAERAYEGVGDDDDEPTSDDDTVRKFLETLVASEKLLLAREISALDDLQARADEPEALYEALLDHPAVDDVFVSETELIELWRRFRLQQKK